MPKATTEVEAAQQIADAINCISQENREVGVMLANIHPTLQQSFMRIVIGFLQEEARKTYVDLRNEATRDLARKLLEGIDESDLYMPLV